MNLSEGRVRAQTKQSLQEIQVEKKALLLYLQPYYEQQCCKWDEGKLRQITIKKKKETVLFSPNVFLLVSEHVKLLENCTLWSLFSLLPMCNNLNSKKKKSLKFT